MNPPMVRRRKVSAARRSPTMNDVMTSAGTRRFKACRLPTSGPFSAAHRYSRPNERRKMPARLARARGRIFTAMATSATSRSLADRSQDWIRR